MVSPDENLSWNELQQVGTDFANQEEVRAYDERMSRFRDFDTENDRVFSALDLSEDATIVEIGCGTGTFALAAARRFRNVIAYDISEAMLEFARDKAQASGLDNIRFCQGGFLGCHEDKPPVDAVVTQFAMHHLPDFWKEAALRRIAKMLKPNGKLFLNDVIFSFPFSEYPDRFSGWIDSLPPDTQENARGHLSREYSTQGWLMRELLARSGFRIVRSWTKGGFFVSHLCVRQFDPDTVDDCSKCLAVDDDLAIHQLTPDWAGAAFEWLNSNREHLARWTSFPERVQTVEDEEAFLRAVTEVPPGRREFVGRIMVGNQFAGSIGTVRTDPVNRTTEVGYSLGKEFEGNGIMTRCCKRLLEYLFNERNINRIVVRCAVGNKRSAAVAKRLGFQLEGIQRQAIVLSRGCVDVEMYSLLKEDWTAERK